MRDRMNVYFPPELLKQISELADRKKLSRSAIVEAAVASFLSPDGADRREAAFTRRLDRLSRQMQRLERDVGFDSRDHGPLHSFLADDYSPATQRRAGGRAGKGSGAL
ncbi:putative transcriptional regulator [Bradyrhizobium elkanii]|uniref:Transcriptional regulator n=1 Tax=Bradyrhizobium elkanii TaxID=29448 RepID=A0ABV4F5I3_BRAEL